MPTIRDRMSFAEGPSNERLAQFDILQKELYGPEYVEVMKKHGYPDDQGMSLADFVDTDTGGAMANVLRDNPSHETAMQALQAFDRYLQTRGGEEALLEQPLSEEPIE
ncbi:MAG: hypothetical protein MN733_03455 [Nitrososphaera sp.]|nr:hypothetical protein [Nitrososphaera sp.]